MPQLYADNTFVTSDYRPQARFILGMRVDHTTYEDAAERIVGWAAEGESRYVCVATVNNVMEAHDDPKYRVIMNAADLVTPDGMPLVWGLRILGVADATRVYGPDLTPIVCERASRAGIPVAFYGGGPDVLDATVGNLKKRFPSLEVAYSWSPPFRPLSPSEDDQVVASINASGARILFVGLGSPKQDRWMAEHRNRVRTVMLGVGAAFDLLAGTKRRAPRRLQAMGLEWAFRLATEPRRVWRRYARHNPRFLFLFPTEVVRARRTGARQRRETVR
jgi:N-acetylglucosaminyldiphosphoundecaprenol N-acetyl-beta-D-mannosaminyltransferase